MSPHTTTGAAFPPPYLRTQLQGEYTEYLRHWPAIADEQRRQEYRGPPETAPLLSIVVPVYHPVPSAFHEALRSVLAQHYPHWELLLILDGPQPSDIDRIAENAAAADSRIALLRLPEHSGISAATNAGIRAAHAEYVGLLDHDDLLEPAALGMVASAIAQSPYPPDLLYTDHDKIDMEGRRYDPEFKPDWSPETLLSHCYVGHWKVLRKAVLLALDGFRQEYDGAQDYDLLLRLAERAQNVVHIPHILYHWRSAPGSTAASATAKPHSIERGRCAVEDALRRRRKRGGVILPPFAEQCNIGVYSLAFDVRDFTEKVTIVIPTRDRHDLLEPCLRSIRTHTTYPHYDILVVNNGTGNAALRRLLQENGAQWCEDPTQEFNFSKLLNHAAEQVQTPLVLFLNDDTEVLSGNWLLQMLGTISLSDHIGAVGAKLLFPTRCTQHAGIVLGLRTMTAGHLHRGLPHDHAGYRNTNRALRNVAAVTGACLLTRTATFREMGGFDEKQFQIAYNDVDYCLRLLARGLRIIQNPTALLRHHQAATRGKTFHPDAEYASRAALRRTWLPLLRADPYYNPNLSRHDEHIHIRSHPPGKRILLTSHNLAYEGASLSLLDLAVALREREYHVEVVAAEPGPLADAYAERHIQIHTGTGGGTHPLLTINRDAFDIILLNTITLAPLLAHEDIAACPTILCIRESERNEYTRTLSGFSPQLFSKASRVLFVANATQEVYRDLDRGHFRTIHTGIDIAQIDAASQRIDRTAVRRALGIKDADLVISTIGTICPRKGQKELVRTVLEFLPSSPSLHCILVGGGTESAYEEELQSRISHSGFRTRIHLLEKTPDVDRFYAASDILVCNSSIESFPRVVLEAMAWRLPIIATDTFGIPEQIRDGTEGLLVPSGQPEALTSALRRLLEDQTLRTTLAQNARARAEREFGITQMVDQYEELFRELFSTPLGRGGAHDTSHRASPPGIAAATRRGRGGARAAP